jgi:hypothetical protein
MRSRDQSPASLPPSLYQISTRDRMECPVPTKISPPRVLFFLTLVLLITSAAGCSSSAFGWHVQTYSTAHRSSFDYKILERQPVAIFGALGMIPIAGNEVGVSNFLAEVLSKVAPGIQVIDPLESVTRINKSGLGEVYGKMHEGAMWSNILAQEPLQRLGAAVGARYVFQPRVMLFNQSMTDRWAIPIFGVRISQTRATVLRLALQLWDAETGALLWFSAAEGTMQGEAMSQDPVYFKDVAEVTLGSMIQDFVSGRSASMYTPVNVLLDALVQPTGSQQ